MMHNPHQGRGKKRSKSLHAIALREKRINYSALWRGVGRRIDFIVMSKLSFDIDAVIEGKSRLTDGQALELYHSASMHDLGEWTLAQAQRMHPEDYRTYVIDRNINYTNVCTAKCTFCAFRRDHEDSDAYTLTYEQIGKKISELVSIGGTQILMQGGMNDQLPIE